MSPASGFSINAHEEPDLQELLNDIDSPDDDSRSIGFIGSNSRGANLREERYKQKLMRGWDKLVFRKCIRLKAQA